MPPLFYAAGPLKELPVFHFSLAPSVILRQISGVGRGG